MSILTKIFVVLTTIMAVLVAALIVPYVKNTDTLTGELENERQLNASLRSSADTAANALTAAQDEITRLKEQATSQNLQLLADNRDLAAQVKNLMNDVRRLQDDLDVKDGQIELVSAGTKQQAEIITTLQGQLTSAQTEFLNVSRQLTGLNDDLQDKAASLETAQEQIRLLAETAQDLANQLEQAKATGTASTTDGQVRPVAAVTPIRGTVTAVRMVDGQTHCSISVGRNDGVAEGMVFLVHDGNHNLLGELQVTNADLNDSAGKITLKQGHITTNSLVLTADN